MLATTKQEPRERPILFSGPMVRAILDGRKTQTRRVVKPQPPPVEPIKAMSGESFSIFTDRHTPGRFRVGGPVWAVRKAMKREPEWTCPYGQPGDRLWVRETWAPQRPDMKQGPVMYAADGSVGAHMNDGGGGRVWVHHGWIHGHADPGLCGRWFGKPDRWRPSIHMPRWASRLTLEVVSVRVERLHAISEEDARAEGLSQVRDGSGMWLPGRCAYATWAFRELWTSINGPESWDANPWVWVVEFKRV